NTLNTSQLPSVPTRRSSDLGRAGSVQGHHLVVVALAGGQAHRGIGEGGARLAAQGHDRDEVFDKAGRPTLQAITRAAAGRRLPQDRKSTRLNSSHSQQSYAV